MVYRCHLPFTWLLLSEIFFLKHREINTTTQSKTGVFTLLRRVYMSSYAAWPDLPALCQISAQHTSYTLPHESLKLDIFCCHQVVLSVLKWIVDCVTLVRGRTFTQLVKFATSKNIWIRHICIFRDSDSELFIYIAPNDNKCYLKALYV